MEDNYAGLNKGRSGFTQVTRIVSSTVGSLVDPLTVFLSQKSEIPPPPPQAAPESSSIPGTPLSSSNYPADYSAYSSEPPSEIDLSTVNISTEESTEASDSVDNHLEDFPLLTNERIIVSLKDCFVHYYNGRLIPGILIVTTYKITFLPSATHLNTLAERHPSIYSFFNIPLAAIDKVEKEKRSRDFRNAGVSIIVCCKDVRNVRITIQTNTLNESDIEKAIGVMMAYAFPNEIKYLFAFSHSLPSEPLALKKVEQFDIIKEFTRQGIDFTDPNCQWRRSSINKEYRLCDSYPSILVVPKRISEEELFLVAAFRAGSRLPILCWSDSRTGASMWRSSQPKAGVSGSCLQDEKYLDIISKSCTIKKDPLGRERVVSDPILHIVDCRPRTSAMANRAAGAGYESQTNYPTSRLDFYNIGNIHVMRDSFQSLASLILNSNYQSSNDPYFSKSLEDTQWLTHVRMVLKASWETANFIQKGMPVLVHCSHGWDRTSQVCALAQLLLDPFYRTLEGFQMLVEKEWCSFGHQFQLRCGHSLDRAGRQNDQISPIFLQFLDCVWQILHQFPHYFEFNARYILTIADHIYSARFGTFLFNCEQDRMRLQANELCVDIWTYLHYNKDLFRSILYMDPYHESTPTTHVLLPPLSILLRNVVIWTDYFFRWSVSPSQIHAPVQINKSINPNKNCRPISVREDLTRCTDLEVSAIVCNTDIWEGSLLSASVQQANLLNQLSEINNNPTSFISKITKLERKVQNLVSLLRDQGVFEELIAHALEEEEEGEIGGVAVSDDLVSV